MKSEVIDLRWKSTMRKEVKHDTYRKLYRSRYVPYNGHTTRYKVYDSTDRKSYIVDDYKVAYNLYYEIISSQHDGGFWQIDETKFN